MKLNSREETLKKGKELLAGGGLSQALVLQRQEIDGYNDLPSSKPKKLYNLIIDILKEPMVYLLLGCGIIYFFLGDHQEAIMLLSFLFFIIGITITQESKMEKALDALKKLSSPRALVLRNGNKIRVSSREIVLDDILFLNEGDRVSADAIIIHNSNLIVDESLVTGESVPVAKIVESELFAGTTVVGGNGIAIVYAVGLKTQIGQIGQSILESEIVSTRLEEQTNQLVKRLAYFASGLCVLVFVVHSSIHHNWIEGTLVGLSLGMAILPNELPAVLTIFFALGAWRLSKRKVLTRKISAIENLGSITVLCVDKTGTLTMNQMTIQMIYSQDQFIDVSDSSLDMLPEKFHEVLEFGILASKKDPMDPMEIAFQTAGSKYLKGTEHLHHDWNLEREYPLSPELLSITHAWKPNGSSGFVIGAKGAPEAIIDLCHTKEDQAKKLMQKVEQMATSGLRVLAVAKSHRETASLPFAQHDFEFVFLGLIGVADPIRIGVHESISECYSAGIRVIMLTGDYPITAKSIAQKIGLQNYEQIVTGIEMEKLTDKELSELTKKSSVFSRVMPSHKLKLVEALKAAGEIVAMTGDGVNDVPALKSSNIGIAMGGRGTDVAREASDLVLLDDDFTSIVEGIKIGRRIYSNVKSALVYLFAIHIPIAGMSVLPVILGMPLVLLPSHIAFLHLIIEPASSIAFEIEPAGTDIMKRKPRASTEPLYNYEIWQPSLYRGITLFIALASVYFISLWRNQGETDARALVFTTLIISNTLLIFLSRGSSITLLSKFKNKPNAVVKWLLITSMIMLALTLYVPELRKLLQFSFLHPIDILICVLIALANTFFCELLLWYKFFKNKS